MNRSLETNQVQGSALKQITDEQINECMQFCTMYNILHAIHNFKIELKNVDEKKRIKIKTKQVEETAKGSSLLSKNKQVHKKVSKFEKPRTSKKKQIQKPIVNQQQQSDVDNYNYSHQPFTTSRLYEQPLNSSHKKNTYEVQNTKAKMQSSPKENDLSVLISNLAVTNHQSSLKIKNKQKEDSPFSNFYMNSTYQPEQSSYDKSQYGSKYYGNQNIHAQNVSSHQKNNMYDNNKLTSAINTNNQYLSSYQPYSYINQQNNSSKTNPYSQASYQGINYDLNNFIQQPMNKSPSQYTNFTSSPYTSQFDTKSNYSHINKNMDSSQISRNLFHQQSSPLFNTSNQNHFNFYDQKNYYQPEQNIHTKNNPYIKQTQYNHYENQISNQGLDMPMHSNYMQYKNQQHQSQYSNRRINDHTTRQYNQGTPTKMNTSRINNRSLSPLGSSNSCRNFFMHSPRDISDDKSQTSRSKSRRKQRPGGSKSFYQPSLSGRKIVSKQKQSQIPTQNINNTQYYQSQDQFYQTNKNDSYEAPYFRQQQQEQVKSYYQKKYPNRMTRETEISAISGWEQRSHPQKSTKSQQVIVSQQYQKKLLTKNHQKNKNSHQQIEKRKKKNVKESYSEHSSEQSSQVQLDNIEAQMEQLSNSRKKIPVPIKIDMTKKENYSKKNQN